MRIYPICQGVFSLFDAAVGGTAEGDAEPRRGNKVVRLTGGREFSFSSFVLTKEEKETKRRRKTTRGGFRTSSRNRRWLGLQVFALTRTVRSSFPHAATAARGPLPSGLPLLKTTRGGLRAPIWTPPGSARTHPVRAGHLAGPRVDFRIFIVYRRRGGRPRPPVPVNLRTINQPCRGRLSRRPVSSNFLNARRKKVAASPLILFSGRQERRPLRKRINRILRNSMVPWAAVGGGPYGVVINASGSRYTGRPGVRPVRKEFDNAACGPSGSLAPTETTRSQPHQRGPM